MSSTNSQAEPSLDKGGGGSKMTRAKQRRALMFAVMAILVVPVAVGAYLYLVARSPTNVPPEVQQPVASKLPSMIESLAKGNKRQPLPIPEELASDTPTMVAEAEAIMSRLVELYPDDPDAQEVKARLHLYRGDTSEAEKAWQRCLQLNPNYPHAYNGLGSVAAKRGDHEAAANHYRQALRLLPGSSQSLLGLATALIDLGDVEEGIKVLEQQTQANPLDVESRVLLGMAYTQQRDHEKAKEHYEAAIACDPRHANARWGLANACERLGLKEEGRKHRQEFQRLRAGEREVRQRERQQFDDLAALQQDMAGLYTNAARVCIAHGDGPYAEQLWRRAAALHPQDINCRQALAWYYLQQKQPLDTIRMLEELARLEPQNTSYPLEIARLHLLRNQLESAEKVLQELCAAAPQDPAAHAALAEVYLRRQKSAEALRSARAAVELDPSPTNFVLLSAARELDGDLTGALQSLQQAINRDSANAQYREMYTLLEKKINASHAK